MELSDFTKLMILVIIGGLFIACMAAMFMLSYQEVYKEKIYLKCYDKSGEYMGRFEDTFEGESVFFAEGKQVRNLLINNTITELDCYYDKYLLKH